jgi:hypothetical protein
MKVSGARHCKTWDPAPAPWSEFAVMGWQVCFQASKRTFHSFSTFRAFPALPGAVRGTFMERDCIRHMNFSFMRRPIIRAAYATLWMKHAIGFQLEILRDCAAPRKVKILGCPANASLSEDWNWQKGAIPVDNDGVGLRFPAAKHNARIFALVKKRGPHAAMRCPAPFLNRQVRQLFVGSNNAASHPVVPGMPRYR